MRTMIPVVAVLVPASLVGCSRSSMVDSVLVGALVDAPDLMNPESEPQTPWITKRVGGDLFALTTGTNGDYRYELTRSRVDTELPEGYPAPTPPGAIELKNYPAARRAEVSGSMNPDLGSNLGFWPLFQHIQRNDIAMTSPVEMDYRDWDDAGARPGSWTMSFLYRTPDMGATGADGRVQVVDTEPLTVISIGMTGRYGVGSTRAGLEQLREWLGSQSEWVVLENSSPRAMYYNDPSVPDGRKWMEVQIPVRRTGT